MFFGESRRPAARGPQATLVQVFQRAGKGGSKGGRSTAEAPGPTERWMFLAQLAGGTAISIDFRSVEQLFPLCGYLQAS